MGNKEIDEFSKTSKAKKKRILVGTSLFYPLQGGGEDVLLNWLIDFHHRGHKVTVITPTKERMGYERIFPFEVIRLRQDKEEKVVQNANSFSSLVIESSLSEDDLSRNLMQKGLDVLKTRENYDYYIGYGNWGATREDENICSFATLLKKEYKDIITMRILWDAQGFEYKSETDLVLNATPYNLIKNYNNPVVEEEKVVLIPKPKNNSIKNFSYQEWLNRPFDFVFNNPHLNKGGLVVLNLAKHYPNKEFLVKVGHWGQDEYLDGITILSKMKKLSNVTTLKMVDNGKNDDGMATNFYRKGKYLLYPSILEGFGLMPMEAAIQGTIPLVSQTNVLMYSSSPFSEFIFSEEIGYDPLLNFKNYKEIDYDSISTKWIEKIKFLDNHEQLVKSLHSNLRFTESFLLQRYEDSVNNFFNFLEKENFNNKEGDFIACNGGLVYKTK